MVRARNVTAGNAGPHPHRPAASTPGNGVGVPSVTARDPAPGPAGLPLLRQDRAADHHPPPAQRVRGNGGGPETRL